jgi:hypothetical protein
LGLLKNVVVCLDLNANDACDAGEPASPPTGADGRYTLTATESQAASAKLIALVKAGDVASPTTAIDSASSPVAAATDTDYVMKRPAGSGGPINPLTTLVQVGMAGGMTEAQARENVALQLDIAAAKIDDYQDDPAWDPNAIVDTARLAAGWTSTALRRGATLAVEDQKAAVSAAAFELTVLNFGGLIPSPIYLYGELLIHDKAQGEIGALLTNHRVQWTNGVPANPYSTSYLSPSGWLYCNDQAPIRATRGNPNVSTSCDSEKSLGFRYGKADLSGRSMAGVAAEMKTGSLSSFNTINATGGSDQALANALGSATFPAGSASEIRVSHIVNTPIYVSNIFTDGVQRNVATTLEELIAARPASSVALPGGANSLSLGVLETADQNLRVAFTGVTSPTSGTVQFYRCDLNVAANTISNCATSTTGTYSIETVNGSRVMRFAGHPATTASSTDNMYAEFDNPGDNQQWIYRVRQNKPTQAILASSANRLNGTAWTAMKAQLGL